MFMVARRFRFRRLDVIRQRLEQPRQMVNVLQLHLGETHRGLTLGVEKFKRQRQPKFVFATRPREALERSDERSNR